MSKRIRAKHKIDRRLGVNLWGRAKSPYETRQSRPGQHGNRHNKLSDYGVQLMAKQKLKGYYGSISENTFSRYFKEASRRRGDTGENLIGLLESRLDTVIYRMKFVPTMFAARQFVNHGHILVNGSRINIPSYSLKIGDIIEVRNKSREIPMVLEAIKSSERDIPSYFSMDGEFKGTFNVIPLLSDTPYPVQMEPNLVVEFYSR